MIRPSSRDDEVDGMPLTRGLISRRRK